MLYGSDTWSFEEEDVIRQYRNDERMVRWMFTVRPEDKISVEKLTPRLKLNSIGECLQNRRLQWFCLLD